MKRSNILKDIPDDLKEEVFQKILDTSEFTLEHIISYGHTSPATGWYEQKRSEWVLLLEGEAVISFEDNDVRLCKGDYITIPAFVKHRVSWTKPKVETIWLALHY